MILTPDTLATGGKWSVRIKHPYLTLRACNSRVLMLIEFHYCGFLTVNEKYPTF